MKILHFSSAKTWRGGEQQIAYLYEELTKKRLQQWIFCVQDSAMASYCLQKKMPHFTYQKRFSINPLVAIQLKAIVEKNGIDLVHLHDAHSHTFGFISTFLGNKTPFILSRRVDFPVRDSWLSHRKYNHPSIKKILSVSNKVQQILAPAIIDQQKLQVVHSGVDVDRFQHSDKGILRKEYGIPKAIKVIGNIAAIAPHKDYFTFVDTAEILLKTNQQLKFLIIGGDGGEEALIKAYIAEKKLTDYFILTGFRKDIAQILPEIEVFLFTSKEEGLGTSVIDALACGVPVVATDAGGIPEIIQDGMNGFLASVGNAAKLAEQINYVLLNTGEQDSIIKKGKETAQQFSKKRMAEKTYLVYQELIDGRAVG